MKFLTLLKKELKELLTIQAIISMVISYVLLVSIGSLMSGVIDDAMENDQTITICNNDNTDFTKSVIEQIKTAGTEVKIVEADNENRAELLKEVDSDYLIIIPEGFTKTIMDDKKPAKLEYVSRMKGTSMADSMDGLSSSTAVEIIRSATINALMVGEYNIKSEDVAFLNEPVGVNEVTVVDDKYAAINSATLTSFVTSQGIVVPIVIFILVIFASQMIINAISTEKIDKTLETLLSAPVSRLSVLGAKMTAAAIVALLNAGVYMAGFSSYMSGVMGLSETDTTQVIGQAVSASTALQQLGLNMTLGGYVLLGLQMFMTIMIALSVSLILGAMATDAKSTQTLILPIMFCAMIPYLLSMFVDVNSIDPIFLRVAAWAIPFTHTFTAVNNILFDNMTAFWAGFAYQLVFFIVCMFLAVRLFTSDKIFTISLNFGQKKKFRKSLLKKS